MRPTKLVLRCYAHKKDVQWQAFCLDFDLAVQGETFEDVKAKLEDQIMDYVNDALIGEDREYAEVLLNRRAPWHMFARYYLGGLYQKITDAHQNVCRIFSEPIPLTVPRVHA